jgi:branched-subunit amino acid ABC-type transport system permease component
VSIMLSVGAILVVGARSKPVSPVIDGTVHLPFQVTLTMQSVVIFLAAVGTLVALSWFLAHTRYGLSIHAVAQEYDAARLTGVNPTAVYTLTMGLAGLLAGIAGILVAPVFFVSPTSGDLPMLKGLTVAIFGGLGSVRGTIYAAFLVGLVESLATAYINAGWSLSVLFALVFVIMIIRPNGLFGLPEEERL